MGQPQWTCIGAWTAAIGAIILFWGIFSTIVIFQSQEIFMPDFPSSQTKAKKIALQQAIQAAQARLPQLHLTMYGKVVKLRATRSDDPIQQLQSDLLSDMYDAVRELQVMLNPILLTLPNTEVSA